jgi:dTDP-4-dehydrorhamnose reductase
MLKILVTGSNGQLGKELQLCAQAYPHYQFIFTDIDSLDISNTTATNDFASLHSFDIIVNAAAYTAVDKAEEEKDKAFAVNKIAVENLCQIAAKQKAALIHVSTDYVFDGTKTTPYFPDDKTQPNSVYGFSKLAGEEAVQKAGINYAIVRTSWLYSPHGKNFVKTILKNAKEKSQLNVVSDQIGNPTSATDLAQAILQILPVISSNEIKQIYHYSNEGACSWYDFALAIVRLARINCAIKAVPTSAYPTAAKRPAYSVMDKSSIIKDFNIDIPFWEDSLKKCIKQIEEYENNNS